MRRHSYWSDLAPVVSMSRASGALKFGLACDPERAGFEGGVLPYEVPGFAPHEMSERYTGAIAADPAKKKKAAK